MTFNKDGWQGPTIYTSNSVDDRMNVLEYIEDLIDNCCSEEDAECAAAYMLAGYDREEDYL